METLVRAQIRKLSGQELSEEMRKLEQQHSMTSWEFYKQYREGALSDSSSFTHWAGLCYMAMRRGVLTAPPQRA